MCIIINEFLMRSTSTFTSFQEDFQIMIMYICIYLFIIQHTLLTFELFIRNGNPYCKMCQQRNCVLRISENVLLNIPPPPKKNTHVITKMNDISLT